MKIKIAENVKRLRKERKLTQEQLAEALGVTTGAVHKWESGASMPEIRLLMELAELFAVSVDVLLGYEMKGGSVEDILERINGYIKAKDFDSAVNEAEKALLRYPNDFRIVDCCADVYERKGIERHDATAAQRAIELFERSIPLLPQNNDPEISEQTIRSEIAVCHISLGNYEKAVEILKHYNAGGVNNATIAMTCAAYGEHDRKDTESYLVKAILSVCSALIKTMSAYINYYIHIGDIKSALDTSLWFINTLSSMKISEDVVCYTDKITASIEALSASFMLYLGQSDRAEEYMRSAYKRAVAFDASPVYDTQGVRFFMGAIAEGGISDDLGETAVLGVEKVLRSDERNLPALEMWERMKLSKPTV